MLRSIFAAFTAFALLSTPSVQATEDVAIMNFALNLECLEAEYYSWAAFGKGLTEEQRGGGPPSVGGRKANLGDYLPIAVEIAQEEIKHVELLRGALGKRAVPCPAINIGSAFQDAANAALNTTLSPPFSPYDCKIKFLHGALLFEDVGVMAYNGAIEYIKNSQVAWAARSIMAVEAYHAGIIRSSLRAYSSVIVKPYNVTVKAITTSIGHALEGLLGADINMTIADGLTPADANALAYASPIRPILDVVYLSKNATKGGFFPEGVTAYVEPKCILPAVERYGKCSDGGGDEQMSCCEGYNECTYVNKFYWSCQPTGVPEDVVPWWGQCGGEGHMGPTKCEPKSTCVVKERYFSACEPTQVANATHVANATNANVTERC